MLNGIMSESATIGVPGTLGLASPTQGDIAGEALAYAFDLRVDFRERDRLIALINDIIYLRQRVNIPENFKNTAIEVRSPLPMHISNQITAALSINSPQIIFKPIEFGDPGEEAAAYRQTFFMSAWNRQQREKRRQLFRAFMHAVVTQGIGVFKTFERKQRAWAKYNDYSKQTLDQVDAMYQKGQIDGDSRSRIFDRKTEEYKRGLPYPIETTDIPPETFYYQLGEDGLTRVVEIKQAPFYDTLKKFGAAFDPKGRCCWDDIVGLALPDTEWNKFFDSSLIRRTIEVVEIWDVDYCTLVLRGPGDFPSDGTRSQGTGLVVKRYRHSYGDQALRVLKGPYFPASGITTSSRKPHEGSLSALFAYMHLFPLLNSLLTMQGQAAFTFSYPAYRRTSPPTFGIPDNLFGQDAVDIQGNRDKIVPGAVFPHDIAPMDQPHTTIDLDKTIQMVRSLIDLALPNAVQGVITGETAGYALNQAAHLASLAWDPIQRNVEDAMSMRTGWESYLIDTKIGETVYVYGPIPQPKRYAGSIRTYKDGWMGLGPKELKGAHDYQILLEPASINNDTLKLRNIRDKLDMRLMSPDDAIRAVGGNPVEVRRAWLLHELMNDDEIRKNLKQRVFQMLGTMEQQALRGLPPEGQPGGQPPLPQAGVPQGAIPGVSQGLPTTGFVPPAGSLPAPAPPMPAAPPAAPGTPAAPPMLMPRPSGTPSGAPGGVRGAPGNAVPIPGGG